MKNSRRGFEESPVLVAAKRKKKWYQNFLPVGENPSPHFGPGFEISGTETEVVIVEDLTKEQI